MPRSKPKAKSHTTDIASRITPSPKLSSDLTVADVMSPARGLDRLTIVRFVAHRLSVMRCAMTARRVSTGTSTGSTYRTTLANVAD